MDYLTHYSPQIKRFRVRGELTGPDFGEIKDVVHDARQGFAGVRYALA